MKIIEPIKRIFFILIFIQINLSAQWNKIEGPFENLPIYQIFVSGNNLYIGAGWDLFLSTDGGSNWNNILSGPYIRSLFVDNNIIYVGTAGQGMKVSNNNGISWNNYLTASTVMDIIKIDSFIYVGTNNGILISNNINDRWIPSNNGIPAKYKYADKFYKSGSNLYLLAYWQAHPEMGSSIFISSDSGSNWTNIINNMEIKIIMDVAIDGKNIFMSTSDDSYNGIFKSTNNGETWTHLENNGLSPNTANFLYAKGINLLAGTEAGVFLTINNGDNWNSISNASFNSSVSALFANDSNIYIGTDGNLWKCSLSEIISNSNSDNIPGDFELEQNYPNPFNYSTMINYKIPKKSFVTLEIYDILGRKISTLVHEEKDANSYSVQFNSERLASGIYLYKIIADDFIQTKKMVLLK